jgi:hypothetical protein
MNSTQNWSGRSKVGLATAFCAVFAGVLIQAGREPRGNDGAPAGNAPGAAPTTLTSLSPPAAAQPASGSNRDTREAAVPAPPEYHPEDLVESAQQVMPTDETTAEENEQRGDAIRRLSTAPAVDAAQPLIYALRNDVDIRNRILAIDGLRRAALAGNPDHGIADALAEASRSGDEVIASQANQALAEIESSRRR